MTQQRYKRARPTRERISLPHLTYHGSRQAAPYSPELEPDIVLTQPHASGVDETCTPFGDRRRWQHSIALDGSITFALGGRITLHWVAELSAFSKRPGLGAIKHLRPVITPVADGRVSRLHNHFVRVVGMEKVERRARVASFVVDA